MTSEAEQDRSWHTHDWQSAGYVDDWLARDATMEAERRPLLRRTASLLPFPPDTPVRILDVGAGYGALTEEVLARPGAHVVCPPAEPDPGRRIAKINSRDRSEIAYHRW
jgi:2-polyprenyl-3-methyl-5-hydroxy-6-metoxy-1,4-benzoquinol methylase